MDIEDEIPLKLPCINANLGIIPSSKGSAYLETENCKIICTVVGPQESSSSASLAERKKGHTILKIHKGKIVCKILFESCSKGLNDSENLEEITELNKQTKYYSQCLLDALEPTINLAQYPKSQIEVNVLILGHDTNILSSIINCATLAIVSAGIEVFDILAAYTLIDKEFPLYNMTVSYLANLQQVTCLVQIGANNLKNYSTNLELAIKHCIGIHMLLKDTIRLWALQKQHSQQSALS